MAKAGFVNPQELIIRIGIREGMHVCDFGSGSGDVAIMIAKMIGEKGIITAIDVMPNALESVKAKAKSIDLKNVVAVRANLEVQGSSTLDNNSQDMIFMSNILWQSSKKKEIIEEAKRTLKSGGILAAVEWNKDKTPAGPPESMRIAPEELRTLTEVIGFQFVESFAAGGYHYALLTKKP